MFVRTVTFSKVANAEPMSELFIPQGVTYGEFDFNRTCFIGKMFYQNQ